MHLQARLKAKIPIKALARFHAQKKFKSKIKNLRFTHLFKSVSQYCEFNKVQQECLWVFFFVPSLPEEFKYFNEMPLGEVSTVRLGVMFFNRKTESWSSYDSSATMTSWLVQRLQLFPPRPLVFQVF